MHIKQWKTRLHDKGQKAWEKLLSNKTGDMPIKSKRVQKVAEDKDLLKFLC